MVIEDGKSGKVRDLLPFWARELLAMKDEAKAENRVLGSSGKEGS
jgi:hypothetical protein